MPALVRPPAPEGEASEDSAAQLFGDWDDDVSSDDDIVPSEDELVPERAPDAFFYSHVVRRRARNEANP